MFGSSNIASGRKKIFGIVKKLLNLFGKISRKGILNSKKIMIAKKKKNRKIGAGIITRRRSMSTINEATLENYSSKIQHKKWKITYVSLILIQMLLTLLMGLPEEAKSKQRKGWFIVCRLFLKRK